MVLTNFVISVNALSVQAYMWKLYLSCLAFSTKICIHFMKLTNYNVQCVYFIYSFLLFYILIIV